MSLAAFFTSISSMKCLIFAAGLGTRLKPLTDNLPKALVPINGRPLLEHTILTLKEAGATEIVINAHHFAEQIITFLTKRDFKLPIKISHEQELLDTGGGLRQAMHLFEDKEKPILMHNVDILSNAPLRHFYENNISVDAALMVSPRSSSRQLYFDKDNLLRGWKNTETEEVRPKGVNLSDTFNAYAFSGIHLISPRLINELNHYPSRFSIMEFYLSNCHRMNIQGVVYPHLKLLDVGKVHTLVAAEQFIQTL